ncbi:putative metal-binding motif-containing protein [Cystobacter fuscus]|uniref:putative metal-binding motif-containing protein n=1 Tax=Cystobacter fuscus TaxID=43 RepID=UPI0037C1478E
MNRAVLFLFFVLAGCNRGEAVKAIIQIDPALKASCVVLEVRTPEGELRTESAPLLRPEDQVLELAVFRKDLPADVQLQARALWGGATCEDSRFYNGRGEPVAVHFEPGTQDVHLTLSPPSAAEDEDRDGFVAAELRGADCDDKEARRQPQAQEVCDASDDLNCNGQRGCEDATCSGKTCSRAPTSLVFTSSELTTIAGQCSAQVTVERRESDGKPSFAGFPTPITLASTFGPGVTFHSDPGCTSSPPSSISSGKSSVTFFVRSTTVGQGPLSASSSAVAQQATLTHTLRPGPVTKFAFTSPNATVQAGDCSAVSLEWRDAFDNPAPVTLSSLNLSLTPTPANAEEAALYQDAACTQVLNTSTLPPAATLSFYFRGTRATTFTLAAKLNGTSLQSQATRLVKPLPAARLTLSPTTGQSMYAGQCSSPVNIRITDPYNNLSALPAGQLLSLSTTQEASFEVFWGPGCDPSKKLGTNFDPQGTTEGSMSFRIKTGGSVELKLSGAPVGEARQTHTIVPVVRRGSCQIEEGAKEKSCLISSTTNTSVAVTPSRSFLVFQATTNNDQPVNSFVRCSFSTNNTILCKRNGTTGPANINWQVVERLQGLSVQHFPDFECATSTTRLPTAVDLASSFVLFSSSQDGEVVDNNDFPSVRLSGAGNNINLNAFLFQDCNSNQVFSLQVVQFTGSQVQRDITGAMPSNSGLLTVGNLPSAELSRSIVLSTWQVSTNGQDIYKRMTRGEIDSANTTRLLFHRGAGTAITTGDIPQISWERITFPPGTLVQTHPLTANDGAASTNATLATPVDATRTLLLTNSQAGGQGAGETSFATNDILGTATGRLSLNGNQLSVTRDAPNGTTSWTAYAIQFEP